MKPKEREEKVLGRLREAVARIGSRPVYYTLDATGGADRVLDRDLYRKLEVGLLRGKIVLWGLDDQGERTGVVARIDGFTREELAFAYARELARRWNLVEELR